jgi:hypothetical protein
VFHNQQLYAILSVLAFLGTAFLLGLGILTVIVAAIAGARRTSKFAACGLAVIALLYASILLGFSLASHEVLLPVGAEKYFCEIDCHIANSIQLERLISPPDLELAPPSQNQVVLVQIQTRFDPTTISEQRGNAPLAPNPRTLFLRDTAGHKYDPSSRQQELLHSLHLDSTPLQTPLRPGESYISSFIFETPAGVHGLRLALLASPPEQSLLWGNERSPFHKQTWFELPLSGEQSRN